MNRQKRLGRLRAAELGFKAAELLALGIAAAATGCFCRGSLNIAAYLLALAASSAAYSTSTLVADELRSKRLWLETSARMAYYKYTGGRA